MKTNSLLLLGGVIGAGYLMAAGYNTKVAIQNLEWSNPKVKIKKVGIGSIELAMTLDFRNNSSQNISMEYFTGSVGYEGKTLSAFTFDGNGKNIVIKARSTVPFSSCVIL